MPIVNFSENGFIPDFYRSMRGLNTLSDPVDIRIATYAALLMRRGSEPYREAVQTRCSDGALRSFLLDESGNGIASCALAILHSPFSDEELTEIALDDEAGGLFGRAYAEHFTSRSIAEVARAILDIQDADAVVDLCCGTGAFLRAVARNSKADLTGIDISHHNVMLARALANLTGREMPLEINDVLSMNFDGRYNKVFSNFPLGLRPHANCGSGRYYDMMRTGKERIGRPSSADWAFALAAYDCLAIDGKAVVIMTNGDMSNGRDRSARKYFIDNKMVEAVISLPEGLMPATRVTATAMVLSHGNESIRMVDASDLYNSGRRHNTMDGEHIAELLQRLGNDGISSKSVERDEVAALDFNLSPARHLARELTLENPTPLSDIAISIERGALLNAAGLDAVSTDEDTGYAYLQLGNINDGVIDERLQGLTGLDPKATPQCVRTGDLIITKTGSPFKVAVADFPEDRKVLASGNMYVVRIDPEKANPYYLAAFLSSEDGKEVLARESAGTAISNLSLSSLRNLRVALPSLERQREIGSRYQARLDEIEVLKIKLEKARVSAAETYDEMMRP